MYTILRIVNIRGVDLFLIFVVGVMIMILWLRDVVVRTNTTSSALVDFLDVVIE